MNKTLKVSILLMTILGGFLFLNKQIGYFNIPLFSVPSGSVRVVFVNESGEKIKSIHVNGGPINSIEDGENYIHTYQNSGEGTYQFTVEFESGKTLKEGERYVETGYYVTEIINKNSVETNY